MSTAPTLTPPVLNSPRVLSASAWEEVHLLPCTLAVQLPVPHFTVRELLRMTRGTVVNTEWIQGRDLPVSVNQRIIGSAEFDVVHEHLAVRLTENI